MDEGYGDDDCEEGCRVLSGTVSMQESGVNSRVHDLEMRLDGYEHYTLLSGSIHLDATNEVPEKLAVEYAPDASPDDI